MVDAADGPRSDTQECAFHVFVTISAKSTNGDHLGNPSITKTAAFAVEIG